MGIAAGIVEPGEAKIDQRRRRLWGQDDIARFDVAMNDGRVAAMKLLQYIDDRQQPVQDFLFAAGSSMSFTQFEQVLALDQLHDQVETTLALKGIVHLGEMRASDGEQHRGLCQCLAARGWRHIIGLFDGAGTMALAGINTAIDRAKTTCIEQCADNVVATYQCSRRQRQYIGHRSTLSKKEFILFCLASYMLIDVSTIHKRTNLSTLQPDKKLGIIVQRDIVQVDVLQNI